MKRLKLTVAYDGTNYCGWQIQPNGITVEEVLNRALRKLTGEEVGLAAPQVTYIMHDLRQNGLQVGNDVTTVEEAADEIMRYFRGKHPEETKL